MWVYARHDRTTQPWDASAVSRTAPFANDQLHEIFGVDLPKVRQWRKKYYPEPATRALSLAHAGCSASEQYDRIFRIAALNRQIQAFTRRRGNLAETRDGSTESLNQIIA